MSLTAYVRYDNTGRIVPGGPIVTSIKPKVGDWLAVDDVLTTVPNYKLRGFIRYIKNGNYVAGSLILQHDEPKDGNWKEVYVLKPVIDNVSYYNVAGCERMEYHVIKYTGAGTLPLGTIVNNATPECWYIIDQATGPEDVGTVQTVWNTLGNCQPCIDNHTTTTTTTTAIPCTCVNVTIAQGDIDDATGNTAHNNNEVYFATPEKFKGCGGVNIDYKYSTPQENVYCIQSAYTGTVELYYFKNDVQINYPATVSTYTVLSSNCTTDNNCTPTTTTTSTTTPPYRYYNVNGYSCNPCNPIGSFTAFVPYNTPLTIGYFYNNPENRGYSFEILEERAPIVGGYDLTGEPGYATCTEACP